ncbi:MAG: glycosyltransferase [Firmicutes bacterium]|nr:glycosyltransferase [Bacillota bacterium]
MQPLLSIVIPIYNNERTLKKMVDSILMQKFDNWELLLVDDGATDSCPQIIDDYAKSDNRIKAFHKQNGGAYSGFNFGLKKANGKYITFGAADDTYEPTAFKTIAEQAAEYDYDIIFMSMNCYECDNSQENKKLLSSHILKNPLKLTDKKSVQLECINFLKIGCMDSVMQVYKANIIKKYTYREDIHTADLFVNLQVLEDINSASYYNKPLYNHYIYIYIRYKYKCWNWKISFVST